MRGNFELNFFSKKEIFNWKKKRTQSALGPGLGLGL